MHLSIRSKLTVAFLLVILPFLFLEFFNIRERTAAGNQAVLDNLTGSARTAAATMDAFSADVIRREQSAAQFISSDRPLTGDDLNAALGQVRAPGTGSTVRVLPVPVIIPKLETLSRSLQPFAQYLVNVDARGKVVAADPPSLVGQDMSGEPEVKAVLQGQVWSDSGLKEDVVPGERQGPGFGVCLGLRSGTPGGAICAGIASSTLSDILPSTTAGDSIVLLDDQGQVIYSSQSAELSPSQRDWSQLPLVKGTTGAQPSGSEFVSPIDGKTYLSAQTRISSLGWMIGVMRAKDAALDAVHQRTQRELFILVIFVGLAVLLAQTLGTLLARPILDLTAHAQRLSKGDLKSRITINTGDETQTLAETFNSMAGSLDHSMTDLVQAKQEIARQSEQLQQLLVRTNAVQEDERKRIAFDIHDGVIQLVVAAGYELQAAARNVGNGNGDEARRKLDQARRLMDQTVVEMRRIVFDLHPTSLDSRGLVPSLEKYAQSWSEGSGIACTFTCEGTPPELAPETKVGVYRIVQEALTNTRKHAAATAVTIIVGFSEGRLHLTIEDDGSGFSVDDVQTTGGHLGLMSMSERARTLGGQIAIESTPGHGTRLVLDVPTA